MALRLMEILGNYNQSTVKNKGIIFLTQKKRGGTIPSDRTKERAL